MTRFNSNGAEFIVLTVEEAERMEKEGTLQTLLKDFWNYKEDGPLGIQLVKHPLNRASRRKAKSGSTSK